MVAGSSVETDVGATKVAADRVMGRSPRPGPFTQVPQPVFPGLRTDSPPVCHLADHPPWPKHPELGWEGASGQLASAKATTLSEYLWADQSNVPPQVIKRNTEPGVGPYTSAVGKWSRGNVPTLVTR